VIAIKLYLITAKRAEGLNEGDGVKELKLTRLLVRSKLRKIDKQFLFLDFTTASKYYCNSAILSYRLI